MTKPKHVLVVVDPTAAFHPAVERAAWLARGTDARIELFICDASPQGSGTEAQATAREALLTRHRNRLEQLAEPLRKVDLTVTIDARSDQPLHDGIVRKVLDSGADMVVKDTHFHSVLKRSLFSNTDWSLIRNCPVALLLVKPRPPGQRPCLIAAIDPLHERDKPAGLDHKILTTARELVRSLNGDLHVFHAFDIAAALAVSTDSMTMPIALPVREFADAMRSEHAAAVDAICSNYDVPAEHRHVQQGGTRELLTALTEHLHADIVVMGAVSRSGLKGLFLGNTAEDVLDRLPCDLLIVKPDGFAPHLPD